MRILVIGSGGREHALIWALRRTAKQPLDLFCAPGNAGIAQLAECVPIPVNNIAALLSFAEEARIDLNVVGPEAPLAAGIVDEFDMFRHLHPRAPIVLVDSAGGATQTLAAKFPAMAEGGRQPFDYYWLFSERLGISLEERRHSQME